MTCRRCIVFKRSGVVFERRLDRLEAASFDCGLLRVHDQLPLGALAVVILMAGGDSIADLRDQHHKTFFAVTGAVQLNLLKDVGMVYLQH